jgi:glycosidase
MLKKILTTLFLFIIGHHLHAQEIMRKAAFRASHNEASQVIYEVNTRQFSKEGTFKAFAKHLPRLKKMGVTTIWFMPIQPIGKQNRKGSLGSYYSIRDYTAVNPEFGTVQDFKDVVAQAHKLGMYVMIDWVANHSAWDNKWMSTNPEFYDKDTNGKMHSPFDWSDVVELDYNNPGLRDTMIASMQYWVAECDIDGFRCDVADMVPISFWMEARSTIDLNKKCIWLAETGGNEYLQAFDIVYGWEWMHVLEEYHKGKANITKVDSIAQWYLQDYHKGKYRLIFTTNHDENSWNGTEYERYGTQAKDMAKLCMLMPGVPLIYNGQEEPLKKRLLFFEKDVIGFKKYQLAPFYHQIIKDRLKYYNVISRNENPLRKISFTGKGKSISSTFYFGKIKKSVVVK